jgi:beta-aspartyl-peptidase (threonine type)
MKGSLEEIILEAISAVEGSGLVNAGLGSHLTEDMQVECEASFASTECYASVACLRYLDCLGKKLPLPSILAHNLALKQRAWRAEQHKVRPPLLLAGKRAFEIEVSPQFLVEASLFTNEKK